MVNVKRTARQVATSLGYRISKISPAIEYPFIDLLNLVVKDHMLHTPDFFFMQIGASDGRSSDPIHDLVKRYHWRGLLVEPQPIAYHQLLETYRDEPQLCFENVAVGYRDGTETLYAVKREGTRFPYWYYQIASLQQETVLGALHHWKYVQKDAIPGRVEDLIEELSLPSRTVTSLLDQHQIEKIDLLVIDTMGFDFEILKMFPFDRLKPAIIHFEHNHLSSIDKAACLSYLAELGYSLGRVAVDTIAYLNAPTRKWSVDTW